MVDINLEPQIEAIINGKPVPPLSDGQDSDYAFLYGQCVSSQKKSLAEAKSKEEQRWKEKNRISFFSSIRFYHNNTGFRLHSHPEKYYTGSAQQQVTCNLAHEFDNNDYFEFRPVEKTEEDSSFVKDGDKVKIFHSETGALIFTSTAFNAPQSHLQEVSCVPESQISEETEWVVKTVHGENFVDAYSELYIFNKKASCYLGSHDVPFRIQPEGPQQQEVVCVPEMSKETVWVVFRGQLKFPNPLE